MASRIKKGDLVAVIAGKDKGETGTVLRVDHERDRVLVEGRKKVRVAVKSGAVIDN